MTNARTRSFTLAAGLALLCLNGASVAQTLTGVTLEPASAQVGETVKITSRYELGDNPNCAVKIHFGDGNFEEAKINQAKDATLVVTHRYTKPGTYTVMVEPKRSGLILKCLGANARAQLLVAPPRAAEAARPASPAATAAKATPSCPPGWKLDQKSVDARKGAFRCTAAAGTPPPATRLECPGALNYIENTKKGLIGCQP